jgi:hypothetical protein
MHVCMGACMYGCMLHVVKHTHTHAYTQHKQAHTTYTRTHGTVASHTPLAPITSSLPPSFSPKSLNDCKEVTPAKVCTCACMFVCLIVKHVPDTCNLSVSVHTCISSVSVRVCSSFLSVCSTKFRAVHTCNTQARSLLEVCGVRHESNLGFLCHDDVL